MRWRVGLLVVVLAMVACASAPTAAPAGISVVAGENFWGSLASKLGGTKVSVRSVVTDPNADPHEYESSAADARAFADAKLVVLNGAGYDTWGQKLLDANPSSDRRVLDVANLLGKKRGDNPHFWYGPGFVTRVVDRISSEYESIDAGDAGYFELQRRQVVSELQPYLDEVASIRQRFSGAAIGSTESIFVYMAQALGLDLTTPPEFMNAVAEGTDPPASAVARFQDQISRGAIKALVYNSQTTTEVTTNLKTLAASHHIPAVAVSETIQLPSLAFHEWQLKQLQALDAALGSAR